MASFLNKVDFRRLTTTLWPTVNEEQLPEDDRLLFVRRRNAVLEYLANKSSKDACKIGGFCRHELVRIVKRCIADGPDGRIVGFRGCLPYYRTKPYKLCKAGLGTAGLLSALFCQYPRIEEALEDFALRKGDRLALPARIGLVDIRNKFLALCRDAGIPATSYPFNTVEGGIRSLSQWRNRFLDTHGRSYLKDQFGAEAARNYDGGWEVTPIQIEEPQILVFDEYTIDTFVSIGVRQKDASTKWLPMARFKVISGRRRGSKDIVVCRVVLKTEPNTADFLETIEAAIRPHDRMEFSIPGFAYPNGPCFASELPRRDWALPSLIMLDNSKVHLSEDTRRVITERLGCTVQYGVVRRPRARGDIENWHSFLAREFRKLASTTATGPRDPRRIEPEKAAVELRLEVKHIEQLLELLMARFNSKPLNSLKGKTPIEAFTAWSCDENIVLRRMPEAHRASLALAEMHIAVRIASDIGSGKQPIVRFKYAEYIGSNLARMRSHHGEECVLVLNPSSAHIARLYAKDGTEIDVLHARGCWRTPHLLSARQNFEALRKIGKIAPLGEDEDPSEKLRAELSSAAAVDKRAALKLAELVYSEKGAKETKRFAPKVIPQTPMVALPPQGVLGKTVRPVVINKMKASGDW